MNKKFEDLKCIRLFFKEEVVTIWFPELKVEVMK